MLRLLFGFDGRVRRSQYFLTSAATTLVANLFGLAAMNSELGFADELDAWSFLFAPDPLVAGLAGLVGLAAFWISFALAAKRWHDAGAAGWLALLALIPGAGFALFVLLCLIPGTPGPNRYGPDPRQDGLPAAA